MVVPEAGPAAAREVAERIRAVVEKQPFAFNDQPYPVTVSLGVAVTSPAEPLEVKKPPWWNGDTANSRPATSPPRSEPVQRVTRYAVAQTLSAMQRSSALWCAATGPASSRPGTPRSAVATMCSERARACGAG